MSNEINKTFPVNTHVIDTSETNNASPLSANVFRDSLRTAGSATVSTPHFAAYKFDSSGMELLNFSYGEQPTASRPEKPNTPEPVNPFFRANPWTLSAQNSVLVTPATAVINTINNVIEESGYNMPTIRNIVTSTTQVGSVIAQLQSKLPAGEFANIIKRLANPYNLNFGNAALNQANTELMSKEGFVKPQDFDAVRTAIIGPDLVLAGKEVEKRASETLERVRARLQGIDEARNNATNSDLTVNGIIYR